jgi:hypothetical protein
MLSDPAFDVAQLRHFFNFASNAIENKHFIFTKARMDRAETLLLHSSGQLASSWRTVTEAELQTWVFLFPRKKIESIGIP